MAPRTGRLLPASLAPAAAAPCAAEAAEFPGLGKLRGPFEIDPNEAIIVGDAAAPASQKAKAVVIELQQQAEAALVLLQKDPQADLTYMIKPFGIAELRDATNTINNLMDDYSAAGIQRLQRLMIQSKYRFEEDAPFPISKKGVVQPRGEKRLERIQSCLKDYVVNSKEMLKFL